MIEAAFAPEFCNRKEADGVDGHPPLGGDVGLLDAGEKSCVHPATGKPMFYADYRSKPVIKLCPQCGLPLNQVYPSF